MYTWSLIYNEYTRMYIIYKIFKLEVYLEPDIQQVYRECISNCCILSVNLYVYVKYTKQYMCVDTQ